MCQPGADFFNVHSNLLVVYSCEGNRCLVLNPHVVPGEPQGFFSLLTGARAGDTMDFFPLIPKLPDQTPSKALKPLLKQRAVIRSLQKITDPTMQAQASAFAVALSNVSTNNIMHFAGPSFAPDCFGPPTCPHPVDLWRVTFEAALSLPVASASLAGVNELGSAGARFVGNNFTTTTCAARWKSSNSTIANNTFSHLSGSLTITYLQSWLEGPALIANVSITGNTFHGVGPIQTNPTDTSEILQRDNHFVQSGDTEMGAPQQEGKAVYPVNDSYRCRIGLTFSGLGAALSGDYMDGGAGAFFAEDKLDRGIVQLAFTWTDPNHTQHTP